VSAAVLPLAPEHRAGFRAVWREAFGDEDAYIDAFWDRFFRPGGGAAAVEDGNVLSAGLLLEGFSLCLPAQAKRPLGYLYALCTASAAAGRGYGRRVTAEIEALSRAAGNGHCCLAPAEPWLFAYYRDLGFFPFARERRAVYAPGDLPSPAGEPPRPLDAADYNALREQLLTAYPHVSLSPALLAWQERLCRDSGGGLFALPGGGCACAELYSGGAVQVKELLCPDGEPLPALAALARACPGRSYAVRSPVFWAGGGTEQVSALAAPAAENLPEALYWGFVFD